MKIKTQEKTIHEAHLVSTEERLEKDELRYRLTFPSLLKTKQ